MGFKAPFRRLWRVVLVTTGAGCRLGDIWSCWQMYSIFDWKKSRNVLQGCKEPVRGRNPKAWVVCWWWRKGFWDCLGHYWWGWSSRLIWPGREHHLVLQDSEWTGLCDQIFYSLSSCRPVNFIECSSEVNQGAEKEKDTVWVIRSAKESRLEERSVS